MSPFKPQLPKGNRAVKVLQTSCRAQRGCGAGLRICRIRFAGKFHHSIGQSRAIDNLMCIAMDLGIGNNLNFGVRIFRCQRSNDADVDVLRKTTIFLVKSRVLPSKAGAPSKDLGDLVVSITTSDAPRCKAQV